MHGDSRTIEQAAAAWLARRDGDRWNASDDAALARWLAADTAHRVAFLRLQAAWDESGRLQALGAGWEGHAPPARGHWQAPPANRREQMLQAMAQRPAAARPVRRRSVARFAAAAMVAGCALAAAWGWRSHAQVDAASYRSALGEVRTLPLAEGSPDLFRTATRIVVLLSRNARDVDLRG
jgi:transmembrane sensor